MPAAIVAVHAVGVDRGDVRLDLLVPVLPPHDDAEGLVLLGMGVSLWRVGSWRSGSGVT